MAKQFNKENYDRFISAFRGKRKLGITTDRGLIKYLNMAPATYQNYKKRYMENGGAEDYDSQTYLDDNVKKVDKALIAACDKGSPQALQTYYKLNQRLVDRKEETVKLDLSATDRIKIATQLRDRLRQQYENTGSCPLCGQCKALRYEVCLDTKPKFTEDREVAALALPA